MVSLELARVAERAERYDDMADYMQARVMEGQPLDTEERDMFPSCEQCLIVVRGGQLARVAPKIHDKS